MRDIVERLREGCGCNFPETTCMAESECADAFAAADEITRLRNELHIAQEWSARVIAGHEKDMTEITALRAEVERLRAALESVMIGGNSLAQIIGADHPPHGTTYSDALTHYGSGVKYEAWCCWNAIMLARAALEKKPHD